MIDSNVYKGWAAGLRGACFAAVAALAMTGAQHATAANLVSDGNFDNGFVGWTQFGNQGYTSTQSGGSPYDTYAFLGPVNGDGYLEQLVATKPGTQYVLSFSLANDGDTPNDFTVSLNLQPVVSITNAPPFDYTNYSDIFTANGPTLLIFAFDQNPSYWQLTNVSIAPVPLPGALVMFGGGVAALAGWGINRRRKAATA